MYTDYSQLLLDRIGGKMFLFDNGVRLINENQVGDDISIWTIQTDTASMYDSQQDLSWFEELLQYDDVEYEQINAQQWKYQDNGMYVVNDIPSKHTKHEIQVAVKDIDGSQQSGIDSHKINIVYQTFLFFLILYVCIYVEEVSSLMVTNVDMVTLPSSMSSRIIDLATHTQQQVNSFLSNLPPHLRSIYLPKEEWK
jgi:hypothetical protein